MVGATISLLTIALAFFLFISEFSEFSKVHLEHSMLIDSLSSSTGADPRVEVNLDVTFPGLPCSLLSFDATDVMGSHEGENVNEIFYTRSEFGSETFMLISSVVLHLLHSFRVYFPQSLPMATYMLRGSPHLEKYSLKVKSNCLTLVVWGL